MTFGTDLSLARVGQRCVGIALQCLGFGKFGLSQAQGIRCALSGIVGNFQKVEDFHALFGNCGR